MRVDQVNRLMAQLSNWDEARNSRKERVGERTKRFEKPSADLLELRWHYDRVRFQKRSFWPSDAGDDFSRSEERARRVHREHLYEPRCNWYESDGTALFYYEEKTFNGRVHPFYTQHVWLCDHARHFLRERSEGNSKVYVAELKEATKRNRPWYRPPIESACWDLLYYYCYPRISVHWHFNVTQPLRTLEHSLKPIYGQKVVRDLSLLLLCLLEEITRLHADDYNYYGFALNGYHLFSWDPDGQIQERAGFDKLAILRFRNLSKRSTFVWQLWPVKSRILDLYDRLCEALTELTSAGNENLWPNPYQMRFIAELARGDCDEEPLSNDFASCLLKISEHVVREHIPSLGNFPIDDDMEDLQWALPEPVFSRLLEVMESWELPDFSVYEAECVLRKYRSGAKFVRDWLRDEDRSLLEQLSLLDQLWEEQALLLLKGFKKSEMPESLVGIRTILELRAGSKLTRGMRQRLGDPEPSQDPILDLLLGYPTLHGARDLIILSRRLESQGFPDARVYGPWFMAKYADLIRLNRWASFFYLVLALLRQPRQRVLELDPQKIQASRKRLSQTVDLVDEFVGADPSSEIETETASEITKKSQAADDSAERALLERLLCDGRIAEEDLAVLAEAHGLRAATLIHDVNDRFYDEIGAQLLFLEDGDWTMDALDRDIVKARLSLGEATDDESMI